MPNIYNKMFLVVTHKKNGWYTKIGMTRDQK